MSIEQYNGQLANYKVISELGRGSYGTVYKVYSNLNQTLVMKTIDIKHMPAKKQQAALQEVQILKQLNHPNVIRYHSSFIHHSKIYIIMEYADQGDLMAYLQTHYSKTNLPSEQFIWSVASQLVDAIHHLHSKNIVHRDLKPLNVFITQDMKIKLGDLGVSKIMTDYGNNTRVGTPLFLAPELVSKSNYNFKIDIWSLGCLIYYMCTLQPPFTADNLLQLGFNIVNRQPRPINSVYSSRLASFISGLMSKDPSKRPTSGELLEYFGKREEKKEHKEEEIRKIKFVKDNQRKEQLQQLKQSIHEKNQEKESVEQRKEQKKLEPIIRTKQQSKESIKSGSFLKKSRLKSPIEYKQQQRSTSVKKENGSSLQDQKHKKEGVQVIRCNLERMKLKQVRNAPYMNLVSSQKLSYEDRFKELIRKLRDSNSGDGEKQLEQQQMQRIMRSSSVNQKGSENKGYMRINYIPQDFEPKSFVNK